jgi:predicted DsbA family dithiol-disulfide isomerase
MSEFQAYEYTDINSLTAWIAEPVLRRVRRRYAEQAWWKNVHALRRPAPGTSPECEHERWLAAAARTGTPIGARLAYLPSTPLWAARAARAAEHQGRHRAEAVLRRLREATFVDGRPVDDVERIRTTLAHVPGLDLWRLVRDLESPDVVWSVDTDKSLTRHREAGGHSSPAPTVLFRGAGRDRVVSGAQPFEAYVEAIEWVAPSARRPRDLAFDADEALEHYRSLAGGDLQGADPPARAVRVETATTPLWLHPDEAAIRRLHPLAGVAR